LSVDGGELRVSERFAALIDHATWGITMCRRNITMFGFEKLDVWQKSIELTDSVYSQTRNFPPEERFGLTSQIRRSAISIPSNIAEGSGRSSTADFARFVEFSYSSLMELVTQSTIAKRQGFLSETAYNQTYEQSEQTARMLSGLRSSLTQPNK
jgi:four helix bundle protein